MTHERARANSLPARQVPRSRAALILIATGLGLVMGCGGGPSGPSGTPTSVSVTFPAGGTIFIGGQAQLQATATMSNGSTEDRTSSAAWGSDAPTVAAVSPSGVVTAIAAGEATIFADVNPRGTMKIRVFPGFGGTWAGSEIVTLCEESGDFVGLICIPEVFAVGNTFDHDVKFTQNNESVTAEVLFGDGTSTMTGTVTIGGELELPSALVLPESPGLQVQTQNWKSRSDIPGQLTGTYEWLVTADGVSGSSRQVFELRDVVRTSPTSSAVAPRAGIAAKLDRVVTGLKKIR